MVGRAFGGFVVVRNDFRLHGSGFHPIYLGRDETTWSGVYNKTKWHKSYDEAKASETRARENGAFKRNTATIDGETWSGKY